MTRHRVRDLVVTLSAHGILLVAVVFAVYPVLWVATLALGSSAAPEARLAPWPSQPSFDNFAQVLVTSDSQGSWLFGCQLLNSLVVSAATATFALAIATPAAYAFSRFRFVGRDRGARALLATQMFPGVAAAVPLYLLLDRLGLIDTHLGLVLVYAATAVPFAIFQLRSAFDGIPRELEEAAMVDGATRFGAFLRVALPAARPALAVTALFAFMSAWNEFILAATILSREDAFTLPVVLQRYVGEYDARWGLFAAAAMLVSVPVMGLFYLLQKQFVGGLTSGAIKG